MDKVEPQPLCGASVILLEDGLEAVSLWRYNETEREDDFRVTVQVAGDPRHRPGSFYTRIDGLVREAPDVFEKYSNAVARAVNVRAQNLRARIRSQGF